MPRKTGRQSHENAPSWPNILAGPDRRSEGPFCESGAAWPGQPGPRGDHPPGRGKRVLFLRGFL